jgi:hypothetical protein
LQAPCQVFVDRLTEFGESISHSIDFDFDINIHFIDLKCHGSLLSFLPLLILASGASRIATLTYVVSGTNALNIEDID